MFEATQSHFSKQWLNLKIRVAWSVEVLRYTFPNLLRPAVPLSEKGRQWLAVLRRDGIVRVEEKAFQEVAEYLDQAYFAPLERPDGFSKVKLLHPDLFVLDANKQDYRRYGTEIGAKISFKDPTLTPLFFDPYLTGVIYNYYRRQPYYRNQPFLQKISYDGKATPNTNSNWHTDYLHQLSVMLLVSDVTKQDTHMEYASGSHRRIWPVGNRPEGIVAEHRWPLFDAVGPKGTLFLFDAGGIHRAKYIGGSSRKILHLNITTGHHIIGERLDRMDTWKALDSYPVYARQMMERIGATAAI